MVQVGLTGTAFSLQNELNEISSTVNTSTARGWHRILTKTVLALLRYPEYMISGFSSVEKYSTTGVLLMRFKQLSSEENEKCDAGSLFNFNNVNIQREGVPGKKLRSCDNPGGC
ncbi:FLUCTUATING-LIGHT-ACCLIMATION protein 1, chloroplastic-like isoform X2 [Populus alba]|uniref:FLUCTUATING-LIGHT-ACCLIMATION protein 1, chloroplastic-like isoform X2 n=1 Tax=Populus alba TaxID=43335 RepID=UPI003CC716CB